MTDEEKKEYEELKSLLYTGTISQYGKRKLIDMFEKQQKEIQKSANRLNKIIKEQNQLMQGRKIDYKNNTVTLQNGEKISLDEYNNKVNSATKRLQKELDIQRKLGYNPTY